MSNTERRPHIIFIDDEPDLCDIYRMAVEEHFDVETFCSPTEFLEKIREGSQREPDLLVSDLMMPRLNGLELLRELRLNQGFSCPFLLLSAHLSKSNLIEAIDIGVQKVVEKPCDLDRLLSISREIFYRTELKTIRAEVRSTVSKIIELTVMLENFDDPTIESVQEVFDKEYTVIDGESNEVTTSFRSELQALQERLTHLVQQEQILDAFEAAA